MALTQAKIRVILRWTHIVLGLVILCYIYSPFHKYIGFQVFIKFIVIPIIVTSGIWLWKPKGFNKLFKIR